MNPDPWPTPHEGTSREPLPRVEDLPVAEEGFDQESVKAAFDSFYRHAAQLDAALRTLEAVDSFHRQAAALRADLRTLRAAGWSQQPFGGPPSSYGYAYGMRAPREGVSPALWRILGEVVFLVAVSVLLGVAKLPWWVIVSVMAGAFAIVAAIEWAASRERWTATVQAPVTTHPVLEAEPAPRTEESEAMGWTAFEQAQEPSDAMTIIGAPADAANDAPAEPAQAPPDVAVQEPTPGEQPAEQIVITVDGDEDEQPAAEPAAPVGPPLAEEAPLEPRRRWWRRSAGEAEPIGDDLAAQHEAPRHVRILGPEEQHEQQLGAAVDPWEQGFDDDPLPPGEDERGEPDEDTDESAGAVAGESEGASRRRFRRR